MLRDFFWRSPHPERYTIRHTVLQITTPMVFQKNQQHFFTKGEIWSCFYAPVSYLAAVFCTNWTFWTFVSYSPIVAEFACHNNPAFCWKLAFLEISSLLLHPAQSLLLTAGTAKQTMRFPFMNCLPQLNMLSQTLRIVKEECWLPIGFRH